MSLLLRNVRRLWTGGLVVLSMCEPASAQLPPDGSQTRDAQAIERQEGRASAKECSHATPLPADTTITPPAADVPADVARFSGAWGGVWTGPTGAGGPCTTLVVEEVFANGYARVVYSIGVFDPRVRLPRYWRASARIVNSVLSFGLPPPSGAEYTFRPAGTDLAGTYKEGTVESVVTAVPIVDVRQVGCPPVPAVVRPSRTRRDRILASELLATWTGDGPVHNDYFMPIGSMEPARHSLRGTLTVPALKLSSAHNGCAGLPSPWPDFTMEFLTHGDHLVPAIRTIIWSSDRRFGIILSPGRIWSEPGDQDLSRASFPFAIVNPIDNGTLNGLATFVFDDARVSNLRVQITQETMPWARYDYWGQVPMTYARATIPDEARLRAQFETEQRLESPIKPWSALPVGAPSPALDAFDGSAAPEDISVSGFVIDGVVYAKNCHTRTGPYPYCRHMRHGVFSVTKSLGATVALLRLAAKYGDGVFEERIADHVRVTATHDGWKDVTFADVLSMAVPIGDIGPRRDWPDPAPDENQPKMLAWLIKARTAQEKLDHGFNYGRYPWARGQVVRYNTIVTFTLAAAMDAYLKRKEGPNAHLWDMVTDEVYRPIGILHAPMMHTVEPDGNGGIPILGYGLTPTIDDLAKLVNLLQARGQHHGTQILSAAKIDEALRRTATGLSTRVPSRFGDQRYHLSFWSLPYRTALGCNFHVPYMWGYGGNFVVLLPNFVSAFRFADGSIHDPETMILAGEAIRPFCTSAPSDELPKAVQNPPLTVTELRAELPGNTFGSGGVRVFIAPDGRQYVAVGTRVDVGRWRITPAGIYCRTWNVIDGGRERCYHVYRDGENFDFHVNDRWTVLRWTRTPGRPTDL
jgi:CubicO group peptidase (beta-lactamase class C family)